MGFIGQRRILLLLGVWCLSFLAFCLSPANCSSQTSAETYVRPEDPKVLANLKRWQGYKFGLLIHQGLYSQLGIVESWELCPEDWVERKGYDDYFKFARDYRSTKSTFNPTAFDARKWAAAFKDAGAKYVIYTTKHHDGFCLFDSRYTEFKATDKGCPFATNSRSNLAKEVFAACREQGLAVGAYFSKPDWSSPYFWWPYYPPKDRNPNYNIQKHHRRWRQFVSYTQNQLDELVSGYGPLDILWLDGCWVRPLSTVTSNVVEFCRYPYDLDISMGTIAASAREKQPGLLIVDRWVQGEFENYLTPEQKIPERPLGVPWESCISMGGAWGWVPHDHYKSDRELIQMLVRVVAKGGNLLLGIGPDGRGEFAPAVYERLRAIGEWLQLNHQAIYDTVPVEPYQDGQFAYTASVHKTLFAIYLPADKQTEFPAALHVKTSLTGNLAASLLGSGSKLNTRSESGGLELEIPASLGAKLVKQPAVVFRIAPDR
jgi:alpha-L-fucosidase